MKSALSVVVIASLVSSTMPLAAQDASSGGPVPISISRAPTRFGADALQQYGDRRDWSEVRKLKAGREVRLTVRGEEPRKRFFIRADDSGLVVLNVVDPKIPEPAKDLLLHLVSNQPDHFLDGVKARGFVTSDASVGADGVFVRNQRVADLGQVIEQYPRADLENGSVVVQPNGFSTSTKIWIGIGVGAAAYLVGLAVAFAGFK